MIVYYNRVVVGEQEASGQIATSDGPIYIGTKHGGASAGEFFNGIMDDVRIYNRALTAGEIKGEASVHLVGLSLPMGRQMCRGMMWCLAG